VKSSSFFLAKFAKRRTQRFATEKKKSNGELLVLFLGLLLGGLLPYGCQAPQQAEGEEVVASYRSNQLYRSEVDFYLSTWASPADSQRAARQFIEEWVKAQAIAERASDVMGKLDQEVAYQLNAYERRLIEHKFANYLVSNRLDTVVSRPEIRNYYQKHPDKFISQMDAYAYFFLKTEQKNPSREVGWMRSDQTAQIEQLASWGQQNAVEQKLDSSFLTESALKSVLEGSRLNTAYLKPGVVYTYTQKDEEKSYFCMFKLLEKVKQGEQMPLQMCMTTIRDIILNQRKNRLIEQTENELVKKAKSDGKVKIISEVSEK
jgi:hypothetical protein